MTRINFVFCLCVIVCVKNAHGKCEWKPNGLNRSWNQKANGQWDEFQNQQWVKTFEYIQTVFPGDEAVVIQQSGLWTLVLDHEHAYYNGDKFARGVWTTRNEWSGTRYGGGGGTARFVKDGNIWREYRNSYYLKTFQHIQRVDTSSFAVILQQPSAWAFVLTDSYVFYNGIQRLSGGWKTTCNWLGSRNDGMSSEFKKISPNSWYEYKNGRYIKTFEHIQTIDPGDEAVVIQQQCLKPLVIDQNQAYYNGNPFASGTWNSSLEWIGSRYDGGSVQFARNGSIWNEYRNGQYLKTFDHVHRVPSDRAAIVMQQQCHWPLIVDDVEASYNGNSFAIGFWNSGEIIPDCEDEVGVTRLTRSLNDPQVCQFRQDFGYTARVILRAHDSNGRLTPPTSKRLRSLASDAIAQLDSADLSREQTTVVSIGGPTGVRIDIQGGMNWGGMRYVNVQVQTNGQRSVTLAQANCPISESLTRDVRRVLLYSLDYQSIVTLQYSSYQQ